MASAKEAVASLLAAAPARCERTNKGQVTGFGTTLRVWPASTSTHQSRHTLMCLSPCFGSKWLRRPGISGIGDAGEGPTEARLGADLTPTTPRPLAVSSRLVVLFRGPSRRAWTALVKPGLGDGISTADARGELGVYAQVATLGACKTGLTPVVLDVGWRWTSKDTPAAF
jgi:hypothetical protein